MILCIDSRVLKTSPDVQKDVNLEDLLLNHTYYFDSEEEALKEEYVPLDFSVSIRSIYSNKVVQIDKGHEKRYYVNLSQVQPFVHKGYDLLMYLCSIGVIQSVDYKIGFDELMTSHSQFQPIGLFNCDPSVVNPIILTHVIISDEGMKELPKYLKSDRSVVNISDMKLMGNVKALTDTLIKVKEKENE